MKLKIEVELEGKYRHFDSVVFNTIKKTIQSVLDTVPGETSFTSEIIEEE